MFKRRKDGGFTLIELMIVIAVIGILAVVLVPKMSGVKDSAKIAGVTTNAKSVEAYVVANIDRWNKNGLDAADLIENQFTTKDVLENPLNGTNVLLFTAPTTDEAAKGVILVTVPSTPTEGYLKSAGITIKAYGSSLTDEVYLTTIKPN